MFYYQQGDVIIEVIESIPENAQTIDSTGPNLVLAEGEATGHAHVVRNTAGKAALLLMTATALYLRVLSELAVLVHEEHKSIVIPKGEYIIRRVREYDHFYEESRKIMD